VAAAVQTRSRWLFARHFLADPRSVGSAIPSSRRLVSRLIDGVDWNTAKVIVEYGPGTGCVTRAILAAMAPDARLYAFDINADFIAHLQRTLPDPRLILVAASAETVAARLAADGIGHVDAAISSLPLTIMPPRVRCRILKATHRVLAPGAPLSFYQYSTRQIRQLRRHFGALAMSFEPRNWPPAFVFTARK
jgi:phospholipid N-methyltransferase